MTPDLADVLRLVNVGREALGLLPLAALPKGAQVDTVRSVLSSSLGDARVSYQGVRVRQEFQGRIKALAAAWNVTERTTNDPKVLKGTVVLPATLSAFERAFDAGAYPELVEA